MSTYLIALFMTTTQTLGLPPKLLSSLCYVESHHNTQAVNHDDGHGDSLGVCQIKLATAKGLGFKGTKEQLMEPKTNIKYAGLYLKKQITRYDGDFTKAVAAYNAGKYRAGKDGQPKNHRYVKKVFLAWGEGR